MGVEKIFFGTVIQRIFRRRRGGDRLPSCVVCGRLPRRRERCGGGIRNQLTLPYMCVQI